MQYDFKYTVDNDIQSPTGCGRSLKYFLYCTNHKLCFYSVHQPLDISVPICFVFYLTGLSFIGL